jgi:hypothetical protein
MAMSRIDVAVNGSIAAGKWCIGGVTNCLNFQQKHHEFERGTFLLRAEKCELNE